LRRDAGECALVRDLATGAAKREMFDRPARHLNELADQVEHGHERLEGQIRSGGLRSAGTQR
jgi:hypothetical protein